VFVRDEKAALKVRKKLTRGEADENFRKIGLGFQPKKGA